MLVRKVFHVWMWAPPGASVDTCSGGAPPPRGAPVMQESLPPPPPTCVDSSTVGNVFPQPRPHPPCRYRNFRTFVTPEPVQLACVAVDSSGQIVCAGAKDTFQVVMWSMRTGQLLDVLSGHEGPVSSLSFNPSATLAHPQARRESPRGLWLTWARAVVPACLILSS